MFNAELKYVAGGRAWGEGKRQQWGDALGAATAELYNAGRQLPYWLVDLLDGKKR